MSKPIPILAPRENVNDETVKIVSWYVADGDPVNPGQSLAQIETSKAVLEIEAPAAGFLLRMAAEGAEIAIGGVIGHISPGEIEPVAQAASSTVPSNGLPISSTSVPPTPRAAGSAHSVDHIVQEESAIPQSQPAPTRFSRKARELMERLSLDTKAFQGHGLVRSKDLAPAPGLEKATTTPAVFSKASPTVRHEPMAATGTSFRTEPLPRTKRIEGSYLRSAYHNTLMSTVTVSCPSRGLRAAASEYPQSSGLTAIILYEAARLVRKYPTFNAFYADDQSHYYEAVNIGFAIDAGRGLKVPVIHNADRKGMAEIVTEMRELMGDYVDGKLPLKALAGATFTVTDLSSEGVSTFHPLINQGQSAILGICAELFPPGSREGTFNLVLSFDHQLSEGRTAARFLNDLRERLGAYESAMSHEVDDDVEKPRCSRCYTTVAELQDLDPASHFLIQTVGLDGSLKLICTICLLGN